MNWTSVKNMLILMLVAANMFLLYNISVQRRSRSYIDEDEVINAVSLLDDRGLSVDVSCVPLSRFDADIYESVYGEDYFNRTAELLSGSKRQNATIIPNGILIVTENGASFEFDSSLGFVYTKNSTISASAYTDINADNFDEYAGIYDKPGKSQTSELERIVTGFLSAGYGSESLFDIRIDGCIQDPNSGNYYIKASQLLDGLSVYGHGAVCAVSGGELVAAWGHWYFFDFDTSYNSDLYDQVNILFLDLETLEGRRESEAAGQSSEEPLPGVVSVDACFATYWNAEKTALYFIPAWQIGHTDGTLIVYNAANNTEYLSTR